MVRGGECVFFFVMMTMHVVMVVWVVVCVLLGCSYCLLFLFMCARVDHHDDAADDMCGCGGRLLPAYCWCGGVVVCWCSCRSYLLLLLADYCYYY